MSAREGKSQAAVNSPGTQRMAATRQAVPHARTASGSVGGGHPVEHVFFL